MKLISTSLGRIIVASAAVLIVLVFVSALLPSSVGDFVAKVFPQEKNYLMSEESTEITLSCTEDVYEMLVGDTVDIFADITAKSSEDEDLLPILRADYEKENVEERTNVFIYKINDDGSTELHSEIDSSEVSDWAVIYVLNEGTERAILKVNYVFLN